MICNLIHRLHLRATGVLQLCSRKSSLCGPEKNEMLWSAGVIAILSFIIVSGCEAAPVGDVIILGCMDCTTD